ncbi:Arc family DNA-binding protein [Ectopseudomonas khazarica]|uniref:Arc family DNA-binding protein n=1 Tax=Ectopseudomonas khazarica TaxID=2502979 RepID=UPI003B93730A
MSRKDAQVNLRIPDGLKEYLDEQAQLNRRSKTAEIVHRLEQSRRDDESQRSKQADA